MWRLRFPFLWYALRAYAEGLVCGHIYQQARRFAEDFVYWFDTERGDRCPLTESGILPVCPRVFLE